MAYPARFYRVSPSCKKRGQNLTPSYFTGSPRPRLILECLKYLRRRNPSFFLLVSVYKVVYTKEDKTQGRVQFPTGGIPREPKG